MKDHIIDETKYDLSKKLYSKILLTYSIAGIIILCLLSSSQVDSSFASLAYFLTITYLISSIPALLFHPIRDLLSTKN